MAEIWSFSDNEYLLSVCKVDDRVRSVHILDASRHLGKSIIACREQLRRLQRTDWTEEEDQELLKLCDDHTDLIFIACQLGRTVDSCSARLNHLVQGWKSKEVYTFFGEMRVKIAIICPPQNSAFLHQGTVLDHIRESTQVGIGYNQFGHLYYHIVRISTTELFKETRTQRAMELLLPHCKVVNKGVHSVSFHLKKSRDAILRDQKFKDLKLEVSVSDWNEDLHIQISGEEAAFNQTFWSVFAMLKSWFFRGLESLIVSPAGILENPQNAHTSVKKNVKKAATPKDNSSEPIEEFNLFLQAAMDYQPKSETEPPKGSLSINLLKHQRVALAWMIQKERTCFGGILADDQGLGKTVSILALMMTERKNGVCDQSKGRRAAGTLIICPSSLMRQWAEELLNKISPEAKLSVLIFHGSNRCQDAETLSKYDVVITSYGTNVKSACVFASLAWYRVVLDEAQIIKNHKSNIASACFQLHAKCRWCLSGTPIQNSIDDLYSFFRFIKCQPYSSYSVFCDKIMKVLSTNPTEGYEILQALLKTTLLRRTKGTIMDGEPILSLPPKSTELRKVELSKEEVDFYKALEKETGGFYKEKESAGMVNKDFKEVLARLMRLRQACNHPLLVSSSLPSTSSSAQIAKKLPFGSSKLKATLEILSESLIQKGVKALVFTQWTKMLDLLEDSLKESSFQYRRFDGKMSMEARHKSIEEFKNLPEVNVMIMSLKAACVGLNLVAASLVLIMDPWWNPTTEDQAIDRVHRIGQTRPVRVVRLLVSNSVEDRLLKLQEKKKKMVACAFGKCDQRFSLEDWEHLLVVD